MGVYLSFSMRVKVNIEALNAVEALGNIVRHRKATVIVSTNGKLEAYTVPVASGESLRHAYQKILAELAKNKNVKVCKLCSMGEFVKHGVRSIIRQLEPGLWKILNSKDKSLVEKEMAVIDACVVEDVCGFLTPTEPPVKRTSRLEISYLVPALAEIKLSTAMMQFHVRHAPQAQQLVQQGEEQAQTIYHIEAASAVYTFMANLDLTEIGVTSNALEIRNGNVLVERRTLSVEERLKRIELAIVALAELAKGMLGAKRSSYLPHWTPLSAVAIVSKPIKLQVMPGHQRDYIRRTAESAAKNAKLIGNVSYQVFAFVDRTNEAKEVVDSVKGLEGQVELTNTLEDMMLKLKEYAMKMVREELSRGS